MRVVDLLFEALDVIALHLQLCDITCLVMAPEESIDTCSHVPASLEDNVDWILLPFLFWFAPCAFGGQWSELGRHGVGLLAIGARLPLSPGASALRWCV